MKPCLHFDACFDGLEAFLVDRFPHAPNLRSAIDFQRRIVILPTYDPAVGNRFRTDLDWIGYFDGQVGSPRTSL